MISLNRARAMVYLCASVWPVEQLKASKGTLRSNRGEGGMYLYGGTNLHIGKTISKSRGLYPCASLPCEPGKGDMGSNRNTVQLACNGQEPVVQTPDVGGVSD